MDAPHVQAINTLVLQNYSGVRLKRQNGRQPSTPTCAVLNVGDGLAVRVVQGHHRKGVGGVLWQ